MSLFTPNIRLKTRIIEVFGQQTVFCRRTGIREDRLSRLIHGRALPSKHEKRKIAKHLQSKINDIFPK
jgi:DNA-binding XRE family transcriptional regulator